MNKKNILMATNLNIWSIKKGVGAPSFYKTLELYNNKNFNIYLYTTEKDLDISELKNINIIELPKLKTFNIKYIRFFNRIVNYFLYQIMFLLYFIVKQKEKVDLFYGYEIEFIPSLHLLSKILKKPFVSRFQGTILHPLIKTKFWKIRFFPHFFSIKQNSDLTIMTDDGTKGREVIEVIRGNTNKLLFIKNGVDFTNVDENKIIKEINDISNNMINYEFNFISVSRLQSWKRVDRSIDVFKEFHKKYKNSRFVIVGEGDTKQYLEQYIKDNKLDNSVIFTGGVDALQVNYLLSKSDIFLSHYQLSNVGNPLWEAIHNKCLVVTINNGDTGTIIKDNYNGIISDENKYLDNANKLIKLSDSKFKQLIANSQKTLNEHIVSWDMRMDTEYKQVVNL